MPYRSRNTLSQKSWARHFCAARRPTCSMLTARHLPHCLPDNPQRLPETRRLERWSNLSRKRRQSACVPSRVPGPLSLQFATTTRRRARADVSGGSFASVWRCPRHSRFTPDNRPSSAGAAHPKRAISGNGTASAPTFDLQRHQPCEQGPDDPETGLPLPAQPVDATQALNLSAGVSNCKVSRGRSFS
jgi:hypothetical protein